MKAVVLETRGKKAAVLAKDGTVRLIRGRCHVGDVIELHPAAPALRRWAAAAAAVALLGVGAGVWVDRNYVACAEVSLDVNPSIVYTLNKRDRVLEVRAANAEAQAVVEALGQADIRYAPLSDAVAQTMALLEDEGYLSRDEDDYVLVNVSADDDARQARLTSEVEAAMARAMAQDATLEYRIDHSDRQTARDAGDSGMSTGRYALWQQSGDGADGQSFAAAPVRELLDLPQADGPETGNAPQDGPLSTPEAPAGSGNGTALNAGGPFEADPEAAPRGAPERRDAAAPKEGVAKEAAPASDDGERTSPQGSEANHEAPVPDPGNETTPQAGETQADAPFLNPGDEETSQGNEVQADAPIPDSGNEAAPQGDGAKDEGGATQPGRDAPSGDSGGEARGEPSEPSSAEKQPSEKSKGSSGNDGRGREGPGGKGGPGRK